MNTRNATLTLVLAGALAGCPGGEADCGMTFVRDPESGECVCPGGAEFLEGMCRSSDAGAVDAGPGDAGDERDAGDIDAGETSGDAGTDAGSGPVNVIVERDGSRRAALSVIFHDGSGAVIETVVTDAEGEATSTVPDVGMVTVVTEDTDATRLFAVQGVRPRDTIRFELPTNLDTNRELRVSLPGPHPGATSYRVSSFCFSSDSFDDASMVSFGCDIAGRTRVLAVAQSSPPAWSLRYTYDDAVDVTMPAWQTESTLMSVRVGRDGFTDVGLSAGVGDLAWMGQSVLAVGDATSETISIPSLPIDIIVSAFGTRASTPSLTSVVSRFYRAGELSGFDEDLGATPAITALETVRDDPSRPGIGWSGTGVRTGVEVVMGYTPDALPVFWTITSPPDSVVVSVPALPDELASLRPTTEAPFYDVRFLDGGTDISWDALRSRPYRPWVERTQRFAETRVTGSF